jgi:putative oxidoreductase
MKKIFLNAANPINLSFGILLIRVVIGVLMAFYGYEKLIHFDEMAASDFWAKNVSFLGMTGKFPLALTIFAEFFCSLLLIVGLLTRLALIPLLICMGYIVAIVGQFSIVEAGDNGSNLNSAFVYFITYLGLFFTGSGKYSLDAMISKK